MMLDASTETLDVIACVVDAPPILHEQVFRWATSLIELAGVEPECLRVFAVNGTRSRVLNGLIDRGVVVADIAPFDARSPNCNKIKAMHALGALQCRHVVLTDCDLAFLCDPRTIDVGEHCIAAKQVDTPNPPIESLIRVVEAARLPVPSRCNLTLVGDAQTLKGYANGGLYAGARALFAELAPSWASWARWILERAEDFQVPPVYTDQVAMLLALVELGIEQTPLDIAWNCPTHLKRDLPPMGIVRALHYHRAIDAAGDLRLTRHETVNAAIARVNASHARARAAPGAGS
jgi:hypothetical protein